MPAYLPALVLAWMATAPCDDARKQYEALSPEGALDLATSGLAADRTRPLPCVEIRALALLVLGRREDARIAFGELFERDPERRIEDPSLPPALVGLIEAARAAARPLVTDVRAAWVGSGALRLDFALTGGLRGARAVRWRASSMPGDLAAAGTAELSGRTASATIAAPLAVDVARIDVLGAVVDDGARIVGRFEARALLDARPLPPVPPPAESSGWAWVLWGGLITAAVAGATVSVVVLAQPEPPDTTGTIGRVDVTP